MTHAFEGSSGCDDFQRTARLDRRQLLRVGALSGMGLLLPDLFRAWAGTRPSARERSAGPVSVNEANYEQLQQMLQARGVVWQHLKTSVEGDEWTFACTTPDPSNAGVQRHYEAHAGGAYGLAAIRAVVKDIDADLKQRGEK